MPSIKPRPRWHPPGCTRLASCPGETPSGGRRAAQQQQYGAETKQKKISNRTASSRKGREATSEGGCDSKDQSPTPPHRPVQPSTPSCATYALTGAMLICLGIRLGRTQTTRDYVAAHPTPHQNNMAPVGAYINATLVMMSRRCAVVLSKATPAQPAWQVETPNPNHHTQLKSASLPGICRHSQPGS